MKFETEYIEKLAEIINENGLSEISLEDGEQAITVRRDVVVASTVPVAAVNHAVPSAPVASAAKTEDSAVKSETKASGTPITSL